MYDYGSQTNEYSTVYHYCLVWFHEIDLEIIQDSSRFFAVCLKFRDSGEHEEGAETMRRQHMMWILGNRPGTPWTSGTLFGRIPKEYSSQSLLLLLSMLVKYQLADKRIWEITRLTAHDQKLEIITQVCSSSFVSC